MPLLLPYSMCSGSSPPAVTHMSGGCVQVKESAGSESRERVYVSSTDQHEMSGSKGTANFVSFTPSLPVPPSTCLIPQGPHKHGLMFSGDELHMS